MAHQWTGTLATQVVAFRGTSRVDIMAVGPSAQNFRAISRAAYSLIVTGGVSGAFGVVVQGYIGNTTYQFMGLTNITAAGTYVLYPIGYSSTGAIGAVGAIQVAVDAINRLDQIVPPTSVLFQSGVATAGISANCTVGGALSTID